MTTKLAVVGDKNRQGSVVLAASPELKKLGIKTGSRLYEIPQQRDIYIFDPTMKVYLDYSAAISRIALKYVHPEDFHQYSIDEFFMDITDSYHLFSTSPFDFALMIQNHIYQETQINSTIGIGDNNLLAKVSMDIEAKKTNIGITEWRYMDVPDKLWPIAPLSKFWGISTKSEMKLNRMNVFHMGDLARLDPLILKQHFGIIGVDWHLHAHGIDNSMIRRPHVTHSPGINKSQILLRDYRFNELYVVLYEHVDEVTHRLRLSHRLARTIQFSITTNDNRKYNKQFTVPEGTANSNQIMKEIWQRFKQMASQLDLYRTISISLTHLIPDTIKQMTLFSDPGQISKEEALDKTIDELKLKYGQLAVIRALSCTKASTLKLRSGLIAGHKR